MCNTAKVSCSGFYYWKKNKDTQKIQDTDSLLLIQKIFNKSKAKAGHRTIRMKLERDCGIVMNHKKILRIKKQNNLLTTIRKRNPYRSAWNKIKQGKTICPNILKREFNPSGPDQSYSTDITHVYFANGQKAYLSATKDLATKEIVHYYLSQSMGIDLVLAGLRKKLLKIPQDVRNNMIIHSDQGVHYTSHAYQKTLDSLNIKRSMSRRGNCWDNAPIESFFGHMKDEICTKDIKGLETIQKIIDDYIYYYNNKRYQWNLKKMAPVEYRNYLLGNDATASP